MMLMFDNAMVHVIDYPAIDSVEVIDKRSGIGGLIRADAAKRFRHELRIFVEGGSDADSLDKLLGPYASLMNLPAVCH